MEVLFFYIVCRQVRFSDLDLLVEQDLYFKTFNRLIPP